MLITVGSARFWLPIYGSAKICGSTDPEPRGKISTKNYKKKLLVLKPKSEVLKKREIMKFSSFLNGFRIKISEKIKQNLIIIFCSKKIQKICKK